MTFNKLMQQEEAKQHRRRLDRRHINPKVIGAVIMLTVIAYLIWG